MEQLQNSTTETRWLGASVERCIEDCLACFKHCSHCLTYCLGQGGAHVEKAHITSMIECIDFCQLSAKLMQMEAASALELCQLCARVCEACEATCREVDEEDSMMQECADMCKRCAESCRMMAA